MKIGPLEIIEWNTYPKWRVRLYRSDPEPNPGAGFPASIGKNHQEVARHIIETRALTYEEIAAIEMALFFHEVCE